MEREEVHGIGDLYHRRETMRRDNQHINLLKMSCGNLLL